MRFFIGLVLVVAAAGCTAGQHGSDDVRKAYLPKAGERYEDSRNILLTNGWEAIKATCSERVICFEYPELATYLDKKESCGMFRKGSDSMKVCITAVPDDLLVDSVSVGHE